MSKPELSVIIVNWNGKGFLEKCLATLLIGESGRSVEVIVVDNGSTDGSIEFVRSKYPQVRLIELGTNTGFAVANNRGIEASSAPYVLTLNNDTELAEGFVGKLLDTAASSGAEVGMWAPKILSIKEPGVIDSVGGLLVYGDGLARGRGRNERDRGQYDAPREVFIPSACAALYKTEMLDAIGLFDEDFFAYCEDTDLGMRGRLAGWTTESVPEAVVYHHYSATGGKYSPKKAFLVERNRIWVAFKNLPLCRLALSPLYTLKRYVAQGYGVLSRRGAVGRYADDFSALSLVFILFKAYVAAATGLLAMIAKRRRIQAMRRLKSKELGAWFKRFGISAAELALKD